MLADAWSNQGVHAAFRDLVDARFRSDEEKPPWMPVKPGDPSTYFRTSALGSVCGRREALKIVNRKVEIRELKPETRYLFAKGHAYHWLHQEILLPSVAEDGLLGWWVGPDSVLKGNFPDGRPMMWTRKQAAAKLGCKPWELQYREVHAFDHEHFLKGHPDAILDWSKLDFSHGDHPNDLEIIELKTRHGGHWMWNAIDPYVGGSPLKNHVLQVQAYMMMLGISHARIIYMKKGDDEFKDGLKNSYAEWRIQADPDVHAKIRKFLAAWYSMVEAAHKTKAVPPRVVCQEWGKGKASKCALRYLCFEKKGKKLDTLRDMAPAEVDEMEATLSEMLDLLQED